MLRTLITCLVLAVCACGSDLAGPVACLQPTDGAETHVSVVGDCTWSVLPDRAVYARGKTIRLVLRVTATGPQCTVGRPCGSANLSILDSGGKVVWRPPQMMIACPALAQILKLGETLDSGATWEHPNLGGGVYTAVGPGSAAQAVFRVC